MVAVISKNYLKLFRPTLVSKQQQQHHIKRATQGKNINRDQTKLSWTKRQNLQPKPPGKRNPHSKTRIILQQIVVRKLLATVETGTFRCIYAKLYRYLSYISGRSSQRPVSPSSPAKDGGAIQVGGSKYRYSENEREAHMQGENQSLIFLSLYTFVRRNWFSVSYCMYPQNKELLNTTTTTTTTYRQPRRGGFNWQ